MNRGLADPVGVDVEKVRRISGCSLVLAGVTSVVVAVAIERLADQGRLGSTLAGGRAELVAPALIVLVALAVLAEGRWPAVPTPGLSRGRVQDLAWVAVHIAFVVPLMTLLGVGFAAILNGHASWIETSWTRTWPWWLLVPVTLVAMDGANWLAHYLDHTVSGLWRLHSVHHSQEELNVLTSFRAHPLMHTTGFFLATVTALVFLGDRSITPAAVTAYVCLGTLPHANLSWTFGPAGRVVVSPAYHRLHHAAEGEQDVNLGIVLTVWDVLVGRARFPAPATVPCRTGLVGRPVTVEHASTRARPIHVLARQLLEPMMIARSRSTPDARSAEAASYPQSGAALVGVKTA
ncbi:MAG TPA: sterol desaturase family protein [Mycobacteriales bacterium]|nr:sterol desaturase family protein [Mycobacteriales bacterium]